MSPPREEGLFGRLALHYKLITEDQLAEATRLQARQATPARLGDILVELGYLQPAQIGQLLQVQREYLAKKAPAAATAAPTPEAAAPARQIDRLLALAVARGASDLHLHAGEPPRLRRQGHLEALAEAPLTAAQIEPLVAELLDPAQRATLTANGQVDFAAALEGHARFRGNAYRQQRGLDVVLRVVSREAPTLAALGLPESLARFTNYPQGLVLVTGPAGCGKSSTLAALLRIINEERREHIITIEDPIEILHPARRCVVNQRQVGRDTGGFARALRAALREDPDVIAIGELRDLETISLALTAAETGHLVLATLHTGSAIRTVDRLVGVFPPAQQSQVRTMLSESLHAVISQRLLARADGTGRVAALEVLIGTRAVANLIRENKTFQLRSLMQTGSAQGMGLLDAALAQLVRQGTVARDEALRQCEDPKSIPAA